MNDTTIQRIKQARRTILEALNLMYPTAMRTASVMQTCISIDPGYDWDLFEKDLFYLMQKGYLEYIGAELQKDQPMRKRVIRLTAVGKDNADKVVIDPTLEV